MQVVCLALYFYLFFFVCWPYAEVFSNQVFANRRWLPVELFLWLDPLVGLSTGIAARTWNVAIFGLVVIFGLGLIFPRGFCGYLCPLGTLIDSFDSLVGSRLKRFHLQKPGWWMNLRFYFLAVILVGAVFGILLSGFLSAIPVLTRGLLLSAGALQLGLLKNWGMVPAWTVASVVSLCLFAAIFVFGFLGKRFWCRYLCPSGALISLSGFWKIFRREVGESCIQCGKCVEACSFDAINPDYTTRVLNCASCQTCAGQCPTGAIKFVVGRGERGSPGTVRPADRLPVGISRRAMLASGIGGTLLAAGNLVSRHPRRPIRPPGSVAEEDFLDLCIRCEECIKVCPGPVLQPAGLEFGVEALWTPVACFGHAGCHQDCNFCTQVCPTQAIHPLSLPAKRQARMGLAVIDSANCLPHKGERDCQLCYDECKAAGYDAIEMRMITLPTGQVPEGLFSSSEQEEMGRIKAPFIKADSCVGCGLCEYRCTSANVRQRRLLAKSAVVIRLS